jgi:hypothetical protein
MAAQATPCVNGPSRSVHPSESSWRTKLGGARVQAPALGLGPLEPCGTLVGAVHAVAATLDRPDCHPVGRQ